MKKALKVLIAVVCIALMSVAVTACSLFTTPKVKGCTYRYERTECDTSSLSLSERVIVNNQLSEYKSGISTLAFSEEGTVEITSGLGQKTTYGYWQAGADVVIPDGPNKNTQYQGDTVLSLSVSKDSNKVLKWHFVLLRSNGSRIDINLYYNIVSETDAPAE